MNAAAVILPIASPAPPYTVNTVFMASMKPPRPVILSTGSTMMMARIGTP